MHVRAPRFLASPLSLCFGRVLRAGHLRASMLNCSGGSFRRERARTNEPVSKNAKL